MPSAVCPGRRVTPISRHSTALRARVLRNRCYARRFGALVENRVSSVDFSGSPSAGPDPDEPSSRGGRASEELGFGLAKRGRRRCPRKVLGGDRAPVRARAQLPQDDPDDPVHATDQHGLRRQVNWSIWSRTFAGPARRPLRRGDAPRSRCGAGAAVLIVAEAAVTGNRVPPRGTAHHPEREFGIDRVRPVGREIPAATSADLSAGAFRSRTARAIVRSASTRPGSMSRSRP